MTDQSAVEAVALALRYSRIGQLLSHADSIEAARAAMAADPRIATLRGALEWIVEDGASDARAVECARAALAESAEDE